MNKSHAAYESHLVVRNHSMTPMGDWQPRFSGLALIWVASGAGYYLKSRSNQELPTGTLLVAGSLPFGQIRASQLGEVAIQYFEVIPARLNDLMTIKEQKALEAHLRKVESLPRIYPPGSPMACRMESVVAGPAGIMQRLEMVRLAMEICQPGGEKEVFPETTADATQRLETFLKQTPVGELLEMNFNDLARLTHCTSRHLSRLFQRQFGMSFNDKRSELRLARAVELLVHSELKVLDVALESGFKSLSQFNQVFVRQFGLSPGRWRDRNAVVIQEPPGGKDKKCVGMPAAGLVFKMNTAVGTTEREQAYPRKMSLQGG